MELVRRVKELEERLGYLERVVGIEKERHEIPEEEELLDEDDNPEEEAQGTWIITCANPKKTKLYLSDGIGDEWTWTEERMLRYMFSNYQGACNTLKSIPKPPGPGYYKPVVEED